METAIIPTDVKKDEPRVQEISLWKPHTNQKLITSSKKRFKHIRCGRRFGKTVYVLADMVKRALVTKDYKGFYVGPTYKQAKMIAWDLLIRMVKGDASMGFGGLPKKLVKKVNESELYIILGNGSRIDIKGSDNADSLRGVGLNDVKLDEFPYHNDAKNLWEKVIKPTLLDRGGTADIIGTPNGFDHFYEMEMEALQNPDDWDTFHFTTYDNPMMNVEEIDKLKKSTPDDEFAQEYMAEYRKKVGLVYPEFNRLLHISTDKPNSVVEKISAVDFGYTNPAAILDIVKDGDANYWITGEWYETGRTTKEIVERIRTFEPNVTYADPAEPDRIKEIKDSGVYVADVSKDIEAGVDRVRRLFLANRVHIHPTCVNLIRELETYSYPDKRAGVYNKNEPEKPKKENDHACDALRYALYMNSDIQSTIKTTDFNLYSHTYE